MISRTAVSTHCCGWLNYPIRWTTTTLGTKVISQHHSRLLRATTVTMTTSARTNVLRCYSSPTILPPNHLCQKRHQAYATISTSSSLLYSKSSSLSLVHRRNIRSDDASGNNRRWMTDDSPHSNNNDDSSSSISGRSIPPPPPSQRNKNVGTFHAGAVMTGTVKFYLRDKGYGFIVADGRPDTDLFVHRAQIVCTHVLSESVLNATVRYPYLKQNERVRFVLSHEMGTVKAMNVTWLNGDSIPPERKNYLGGVYEGRHRVFGEACMNIMKAKNDIRDPFTDEEYEKIRVAYIEVKRSIEHAEKILTELGMDLGQFPTIKGSMATRGRYLFQHEVDNENQKSIQKAVAAANKVNPSSSLSIETIIAKKPWEKATIDTRPDMDEIDQMIDSIDRESDVKESSSATSAAAILFADESQNDIDDDIYDDNTPYKRR